VSRVAVSRRKYLKDPLPLPPLLTPCFLDFPASYRHNSRRAREWQNRVRFLRAGTASRRVLRYNRSTWKDRFLIDDSPTHSEHSGKRKETRVQVHRGRVFTRITLWARSFPFLPPVRSDDDSSPVTMVAEVRR